MSALRCRLAAALSAQAGPSSDFDLDPALPAPPGGFRPAAVLAAFRQDRETLVLTKRASGLRHHPGQIALPGGKLDLGDADLAAAALREAREEVGLHPDQVRILGALPAHRTVTGFAVTPFVAVIEGSFDPRPEAGEVEEVFEVPLSHVGDPARYRVERRMWRGGWRSYLVAPFGPYYIWGATARMLRGLALAKP